MTDTHRPKRLRLGDLLLNEGHITPEQFETAIAAQKKNGKRLGKVLVELNLMTEDALNQLLAKQLQVPFIDIRQLHLDAAFVQQIPEPMARRNRAIALRNEGDALLLGMADPTNLFGYDEIAAYVRRPIKLALVAENALLSTLDTLYRRTSEMTQLAHDVRADLTVESSTADTLKIDEGSPDAPVLKLLNSMFEDALQVRASDIHIEPSERGLRIRQRVDGVLQEHILDGDRVSSALVSRIKLMCGLDISEKRLPQDGRFTLQVRGKTIDVRVSTLPTQLGESAVMRLLDQSGSILPLDRIGMDEPMRERFDEIIHRSAGMLLVTGPTGSGKTTTLYSGLNRLNTADVKIITVEDPVEYRLDRICQVQINSRIGLDFARVLRTILRQDPDIILVGEMRDKETVEIGLRAAITGHFVLSTLHTSTAVGAVSRLLDMGADGFMIAAALHAVVAQRLLRRVCTDCARPYTLTDHETAWLKHRSVGSLLANAAFVAGKGCSYCNSTGFRGRVAVHEMLEFDRGLTDAVRREDYAAVEQAARAQRDYRSITDRGLELAASSVTTVAEVMSQLSGIDRGSSNEQSVSTLVDLAPPQIEQLLTG